jgi:hypothetical protein
LGQRVGEASQNFEATKDISPLILVLFSVRTSVCAKCYNWKYTEKISMAPAQG